MYLDGLDGITIETGGNRQVFSGPGDDPALNQALFNGQAVRPGGGYYSKQRFAGGWLLDGCPLNVVLGQGWLPTQRALLASAGIVPSCPEVTPMAPPITVQATPIVPPIVTGIIAPNFTPGGIPTAGTSGGAVLMQSPSSSAAPPITVSAVSTGGGFGPAPAAPGVGPMVEAEEGGGLNIMLVIAAVGLGIMLMKRR